jgi:hypothetical protein
MNKQHWPLLFGAAGWFCAIYWLAERGTFVSGLNKPPAAVGLAFAVPILLFLVTERSLPGWRARVASISPVLLISMNGWRFIGLPKDCCREGLHGPLDWGTLSWR